VKIKTINGQTISVSTEAKSISPESVTSYAPTGVRAVGFFSRPDIQIGALFAVAFVVLSAGINRTSLMDPDESRYVRVVRNMMDRANYLEPWLDGRIYTDKPPLYFWLVAGSVRFFGWEHVQFAARIVSVFGAVLTLGVTYLIGRPLFDHLTGLIGGGLLLSTVMMIGCGKFVRMDIFLIFFIFAGLWAFLRGYRSQSKSRWYLLMYPSFALATLTKGPVGLVLPGLIIVLFLVWRKDL